MENVTLCHVYAYYWKSEDDVFLTDVVAGTDKFIADYTERVFGKAKGVMRIHIMDIDPVKLIDDPEVVKPFEGSPVESEIEV